jgi:hypothetical protein
LGKKKRKKRANAYKGKPARKQKKKGMSWLPLVLIAVFVAGGLYLLVGSRGEKTVNAGNSRSMAGIVQASGGPYKFRETRPTLSPALFVGRVAAAYRIAKEIPEVLDQLYCYCRCAENFGHKSLLSCYVDRHAST